MNDEKKREFVGPIEEHEWPEKLKAHVVTPGPRPRIHGYDVEGDLARHYSFAETILLALTGELPDEKTGRAFEIALQFLAPISIAEAPSHAATIARLCGSVASGVHGVGAFALAEQARFFVEEHNDFLVWLSNPSSEFPGQYKAREGEAGSARGRLSDLLRRINHRVPSLEKRPTREAGLIALLFSCGLTENWQLEMAFIVARLATLSAEAHATHAGAIKDYPMDYPHFSYIEE